MRELFQFDFKDYNPDGEVFRRPSVRGIIARDGKVLLIYSQKYDYYKFPGGGIELNENHIETLKREVREETGYDIIPESVEAFGSVLRRQKDSKCPDKIFEQENFYYFCDITEENGETNLDDYEREEGFTTVWAEPFIASQRNRRRKDIGGDTHLIEREAKVLEMVDTELRMRSYAAHEKKHGEE